MPRFTIKNICFSIAFVFCLFAAGSAQGFTLTAPWVLNEAGNCNFQSGPVPASVSENRSNYITNVWIGGNAQWDDQIGYSISGSGFYSGSWPSGAFCRTEGWVGSGWIGQNFVFPLSGVNDSDSWTFQVLSLQKRDAGSAGNGTWGQVEYDYTVNLCDGGQMTSNNSCQWIGGSINASPTSCVAPCNTNVSWNITLSNGAEVRRGVNGATPTSYWGSPSSGSSNQTDSSLSPGSYRYDLYLQDGTGTWYGCCGVTVTVNPPPVYPVCDQPPQTVNTGQIVAFTASVGNGTFSWSAPSGSPSFGSGSSFSTQYSSAGDYTVTVTSDGLPDTCSVTVNPPPPVFDFTLTNGGARSVQQGGSVSQSVAATKTSGDHTSLTFSASGQPSGVTINFSPNPCSTDCANNVTISASGSATIGTFPITVTATGGGVTKQTSFSLTVNSFDFTLTNGGARSVQQGGSVSQSVAATKTSGDHTSLTFSASGQPSGVTINFSPNPCSTDCANNVTISASGSATIGTFPITVTATGGGVTKQTSFSLTVTSPPPPGTLTLTAVPNSGSAPLNGVILTANTNDTPGTYRYSYYFFCNQPNALTPPPTAQNPWNNDGGSASFVNTTTATGLCNYSAAGTYTPRVAVVRWTGADPFTPLWTGPWWQPSAWRQATASVTVSAAADFTISGFYWTIPSGTPRYRADYDYNNDSQITKADSDQLAAWAGSGTACPAGKTCDVNSNGTFNIGDALVLANYMRTLDIYQNQAGSGTVYLTSNSGASVSLSTSNGPSGITFAPNPRAVPANTLSPGITSTINVPSGAAVQAYNLTVTGTAGSVTNSTNVTLNVLNASPPTWGGGSGSPGFNVSVGSGATCGQVSFTWNNADNETNYRIWVDPGGSPGNPLPANRSYNGRTYLELTDLGQDVTSYNYSPGPGTYYYILTAFNGAGHAPAADSGTNTAGPLVVNDCAPVITGTYSIQAVNGTPYSNQTIRSGNDVTLRLSISNSTGASNANNLYVEHSSLKNMTYTPNAGNVSCGSCTNSPAPEGVISGSEARWNVSRDLGDKPNDNNNWNIDFTVRVTSASTQPVDFFQSKSVIRYDGGSVDVTSPAWPMRTGSASVPVFEEVAP